MFFRALKFPIVQVFVYFFNADVIMCGPLCVNLWSARNERASMLTQFARCLSHSLSPSLYTLPPALFLLIYLVCACCCCCCCCCLRLKAGRLVQLFFSQYFFCCLCIVCFAVSLQHTPSSHPLRRPHVALRFCGLVCIVFARALSRCDLCVCGLKSAHRLVCFSCNFCFCFHCFCSC